MENLVSKDLDLLPHVALDFHSSYVSDSATELLRVFLDVRALTVAT